MTLQSLSDDISEDKDVLAAPPVVVLRKGWSTVVDCVAAATSGGRGWGESTSCPAPPALVAENDVATGLVTSKSGLHPNDFFF